MASQQFDQENQMPVRAGMLAARKDGANNGQHGKAGLALSNAANVKRFQPQLKAKVSQLFTLSCHADCLVLSVNLSVLTGCPFHGV